MHKSHQTRLTGLSNQLNEQHANQMAVLREEYETKVNELEETLKKLQEPNEDAENAIAEQKAELLTKIEQLESLAAENTAGHEKELSELKAQSAAQLDELAASHKKQIDEISNTLKVKKKG